MPFCRTTDISRREAPAVRPAGGAVNSVVGHRAPLFGHLFQALPHAGLRPGGRGRPEARRRGRRWTCGNTLALCLRAQQALSRAERLVELLEIDGRPPLSGWAASHRRRSTATISAPVELLLVLAPSRPEARGKRRATLPMDHKATWRGPASISSGQSGARRVNTKLSEAEP